MGVRDYYDDNGWVLAASWLPIFGSYESEIQTGENFELAAWVKEGTVGLVVGS